LAAPAAPRQTNKNVVVGSGINLRPGGLAAVDVSIHRNGGFTGDIKISVEGLPTGVTCPGAIAGASNDTASLIFTAAADAAAGISTIRIFGEAEINGQPVKRVARGTSIIWGTTNRTQATPESRITRDLTLAVLEHESAPVLIKVGDGNIIETAPGGTVDQPLKLERGEFTGAIKLAPVNAQKDIKPAAISIAAGKNDGKLTFTLASANIKPGSYTFHLRGDAKFKYARNAKAVEVATAEQKRLDDLVKQLTDDAKKDPKNAAAQTLVKQAQAAKKSIDQSLAAIKKANTAKDITYWAISTPVRLQVAQSPVTVSAAAATVKQEGKVEVTVTVQRKYGFDDAVDITLTPPAGAGGMTAKKLTIPKGQTTGKVELSAGKNSPAGEHDFAVVASVKWNKIPSSQSSPVKIKVDAK